MKNIYFGKNLKLLREKKGLKQSEMLDLVGFKQTTWNGYENEKSFPKFEDLIKISKFFDISETDLMHKNLEVDTYSTIPVIKIDNSQFDLQNKLIVMQEKEIERLEGEITKLKKEKKVREHYSNVAEPSAELKK